MEALSRLSKSWCKTGRHLFLPLHKRCLKDSFLSQVNIYDSLGQVTRMDLYRASRLATRHKYFYTGNQLDSMQQEELYIPQILKLTGKLVHRYRYDEAGNLIIKETFNGDAKAIQERFVYNSSNQLVQAYQKIWNDPEVLMNEYSYRNDRLIQRVRVSFQDLKENESFFILYGYTKENRTTTTTYQREGDEKRLIDCIKIYNEKGQLLEKINPPFPKSGWLPPEVHRRLEESVETYFYHPNGMVAEVHTKINNKLVTVRKHFYVY